MIRLERADIFPLSVTDLVPVADSYPAAFANRLSISHKGIIEPGNDLCRFRFSMMIVNVIVRKRDVKWILPRGKTSWEQN